MTMRRTWRVMAAVAAVALLAACGDDEELATGGDGQANGESAAYCEAARELDEQQSFPTTEQLDELAAAAPDEIKEDVEFVAGRFKEGIESGDPGSVFADPKVEERFGTIEEFEARECGLGGDDEDEDEEEQDPSVTELDPAATRVDVTATEYDFEFAAPAAGGTSFVMANEGQESHVMLLARLKEGATLEEALQSDDPDEFVEEEYESEVATPGEEAVLTADLTAGDWAMVCYIPAPDGQPHFAKGMAEPFTIE
jgi:hypothetical protein